MNRLTLRIVLGLLAAVFVSILGVQVFLQWQMNRALSAVPGPTVEETLCISLRGMSSDDRRRLAAELHGRLGLPTDLPPLAGGPVPAPPLVPFAGIAGVDPPQVHPQDPSPGAPPFAPGHGPPFAPAPGDVVATETIAAPPFPPSSVIALVVAVALFVATIGAVLTRPILQRLRALEDAATRITAGELGARALVSGQDPIAKLAACFNGMADSNQRLLEGQRHLLQAVSHELRTPASRIRFGLEMMREAASDEDRERHGSAIDGDLDEIDGLVEELLILNRLDGGDFRFASEPIDAVCVVREECIALGAPRPAIEVTLASRDGEQVAVSASPKLFRRAIRNLLSNALRHARRRVEVSFEEVGPCVRVVVDDDGPGVPAADRARILEPFARLDASRSRDSGGVGLGLAIVERILRAHHGTLEVDESPSGGARFVVSWPSGDQGRPRHPRSSLGE